MTPERYAQYIKDRILELNTEYNIKEEHLLYEQGILIGILAKLAYNDSKNFDVIRSSLKSLK
jgi:hypothetical protein